MKNNLKDVVVANLKYCSTIKFKIYFIANIISALTCLSVCVCVCVCVSSLYSDLTSVVINFTIFSQCHAASQEGQQLGS
jgi:hypothetical protein